MLVILELIPLQKIISLIQDKEIRYQKGKICFEFVQKNKGATDTILNKITHNKN